MPVGFGFDGDYLYVGGMNFLKSTKYKNVLKNNKVAVVINHLRTVDPWDPRGMKIYGTGAAPSNIMLIRTDIISEQNKR